MPPRKRAAPAGLTLLPSLPDVRHNAPDLRTAVQTTLDALHADKKLTDADAALAALAARLAERIEQVVDRLQLADDLWREALAKGEDGLAKQIDRMTRDLETHKMMAELAPHLQRALTELGATPAARAKAPARAPGGSGRLSQLQGEIGSA